MGSSRLCAQPSLQSSAAYTPPKDNAIKRNVQSMPCIVNEIKRWKVFMRKVYSVDTVINWKIQE